MQSSPFIKRIRRHRRVRARIVGTALRPRLSVARSNKRMYVQLIDDGARKTVCGISSRVVIVQKGSNQKKTAEAFLLGKAIAEKAKQQGIISVVFDRSGYTYHGRVKAVADGAREGGLQF